MLGTEWPQDHRAGFVCLVGRPNAGKSTLTNALVGAKVAITSGRPQTTRRAVRGIVHRDDGQLVVVDTPGLHRPRTLLGERLNDLVRDTMSDVDAVVFCLPANERIGPGDRYIAEELARINTPVIAVVTKADTVTKQAMAEQLLAVDQLGEWRHVVPVSAVVGEQVDVLSDLLVTEMPLSPPLYPSGDITDEPIDVQIAELVREAALEGVRDELPHSLAVVVEEIVPRSREGDEASREDDETAEAKAGARIVDVRVNLFVERSSQKGIIIGRGGARLREVGTQARHQIEELLGSRVFLDLHVKVAKDWQRDPKELQRLGF